MNQNELDQWQSVTKDSIGRWIEDSVTRLNGKGSLFYIGGEQGCYMRIDPDGRLSLGIYEDAFPHIGEAVFIAKAERRYSNMDEAFLKACQLGGKKFLVDLFSNDRSHAPIRQAGKSKSKTHRGQTER